VLALKQRAKAQLIKAQLICQHCPTTLRANLKAFNEHEMTHVRGRRRKQLTARGRAENMDSRRLRRAGNRQRAEKG
jgi:hypothetical protein